MEFLFTEQFEQAYDRLIPQDKKSVRKMLNLLKNDLGHPGLHVKKMEGRTDIRESRPSKRLRMTFQIDGGLIILRNVGEHDKVLKKP